MPGRRSPDPHAVEEGDDGGRTAGDPAPDLLLPVLYRLRTGDAARVQVLHQAEEERQVGRRHALLVEGEDEIATGGMNQEIRVLDPLSNTLVGKQIADVVTGEKDREVLRRNVGVDRHDYSAASVPRNTRGSGKNMSSSAVVTVSTLTL